MGGGPNEFAERVTRGRYLYLLNGRTTEITERWMRRELSPGDVVTESIRTAPGVEISVNSRDSGGLVRGFQVTWRTSGAAGYVLTARYALDSKALQVERKMGDEPSESQEIVLPDGDLAPLLSPLMRIYTGPIITRLLAQGGVGQVVVPSIADPENVGQLLRPLVSERRANLLSDWEELSLGEQTCRARCCEYLGDQYAPGTRFWLGPDDKLLRYCWRQSGVGEWDVRLEQGVSADQTDA